MRKHYIFTIFLIFSLMTSAQSSVPEWNKDYSVSPNWVGIRNTDVFAEREYTITIESPKPIDFFMMEDSELASYDELDPNTVMDTSKGDFVFFKDSYHTNVTSLSYTYSFDTDGIINYVFENTQIIAGGAFVNESFEFSVSINYTTANTDGSDVPGYVIGFAVVALGIIMVLKKKTHNL